MGLEGGSRPGEEPFPHLTENMCNQHDFIAVDLGPDGLAETAFTASPLEGTVSRRQWLWSAHVSGRGGMHHPLEASSRI